MSSSSSGISPSNNPAHKTKDGIIRMLLQTATPNTAPLLPTSPLPPVYSASHLSSSIPLPQTPHFGSNPLVGSSPSSLGHLGGAIPQTGGLVLPISPSLMAGSGSGGGIGPSSGQHETEDEKANNYIHQIAGCEREIGLVMLDHPYAKPWNWKPDSISISKPTRSLFVTRIPRNQFTTLAPPSPPGEIDVVGETVPSKRPYNPDKARQAMEECHRHAIFANPDVVPIAEDEEWEEKLSKEGWTLPQTRLFNRVMKILSCDRLSRLSLEGMENEPIHRRLVVDKSAKRFRHLMASIFWDSKMTQWLHNTLCDNLPMEYLSAYLDILQTLRAKCSALVDKMVAGRILKEEGLAKITKDGVRILLKKRWDPANSSINQQKLKKLPGGPIIIFTPSAPNDEWITKSSRRKLWQVMLNGLGRFVTVKVPQLDDDGATNISTYLHKLVSAVLTRIRDAKRNNSERPIILAGWGVGAAINCQVAAMETVTACICLGFPMFTMEGIRGDADDPILDLKHPVLFVVGQNATLCRPDDIEDMRERMKTDTGLVVVGGADDELRVSKHKKKAEGITQSMVDRCIMDEVRDFLIGILTSPPPTFVAPSHILGLQNLEPGTPGAIGSPGAGGGASGPPTPTSTGRKTGVKSRKKKDQATNPDGTPAYKRSKSSPGGSTSKARKNAQLQQQLSCAPNLPAAGSMAGAGSLPVTPGSMGPNLPPTTSPSAAASPSPSPMVNPVFLPPQPGHHQLSTKPMKTVSAEELQKAKKMLEMTQQQQQQQQHQQHPQQHLVQMPPLPTVPHGPPQALITSPLKRDQTPSQIMASSPLLSSALTSPSKTQGCGSSPGISLPTHPTPPPLPPHQLQQLLSSSTPPIRPANQSPLNTTPASVLSGSTAPLPPPLPLTTMPTLATMLGGSQQPQPIRQPQPQISARAGQPAGQIMRPGIPKGTVITNSPVIGGGGPNMLVLSSGAGGVGHGIRPPQPVGAKFPSSISPSPKLQRFAVPVTTTGAIAPPAVASAAAGSVVPNPGQILIKTTLASGPAAAAGPTVAAATGPGKDNVYIVTLANQDQIKNLDTASIVQQIQAQQSGQGVKGSPSQMVTLAGGVSAKGVIPLTAGVGATTVGIPVSASARDTISLMSSGVLPKVPSAEKRNVAEILASLSGLMPEPQASATAPPITTSAGSGQTAAHTSTMTASSSSTPMGKPAPSILGGNSGAGRLVRVKQQSARPVPGSTATATTIAAGSTTSMSQPGTARVRKQVFVTAPQAAAAAASATASSSSSSGTAAPDSKKEEQSKSSTSEPAAKEGGESATPKESEGSSSTAAAIPSADRSVVRDDSEMVQVEEHTGEHEQDILEEDVNDAEYVPSFKKGGGHKNRTASAKAKPKK